MNKNFLIPIGKGRGKFYILPWVQSVNLIEDDGKYKNNLQDNLDPYGRIIDLNGNLIVKDISYLKERFLAELQATIPEQFIISKRKNTADVKVLTAKICRGQFVTKRALAKLLGMSEAGLRLHLSRFVQEGMLELAFPQQPTHREQSYRLREKS